MIINAWLDVGVGFKPVTVRVNTRPGPCRAIMDTTQESDKISTEKEETPSKPTTKPTMRDILLKKTSGGELTWDEMDSVINGMMAGSIADTQIGGFLMACHLRGLTELELELLMRAMMFSGQLLAWPNDWQDKMASLQSTGSTGNKAKLILAPVMAACGLKFPILSRRGTDVLGGILSKLSGIPGFSGTGKTSQDIHALLDDVGCCVVEQPQHVSPAERTVRDMAQVLAIGNNHAFKEACIVARVGALRLGAVLLDIPYGPGETIKTKQEATNMAKTMGELSRVMGIQCHTVITSVDYPVGEMIGQTVEVAEAIRCLQGQHSSDLHKLICTLGSHILKNVGLVATLADGEAMVAEKLTDGSARKKFGQMLQAQGVDKYQVKTLLKQRKDQDHVWESLPHAHLTTHLNVLNSGYVHQIDVAVCYEVIFEILKFDKTTDKKTFPVGGIQLVSSVGKYLNKGDVWAKIYHNNKIAEGEIERLRNAVTLREEPFTKSMEITIESLG